MKRTILFFLITITLGLAAVILLPYYSINPGVLVSGHTYLQNDCFACHSLLSGATTSKCISCHKTENIGMESVLNNDNFIQNRKINLLHSAIQKIECSECHSEHNGLSRENASFRFSHSILPKKILTECTSCHSDKKPNNVLHNKLTVDCSFCHYTNAWQIEKFDHKLLGTLQSNCITCHQSQKPNDGIHNNLSADIQCSQCHTSAEWKPSTFDHNKFFRFDKNHPSTCKNCHNDMNNFKAYSCYNCHEHQPARISSKHIEEGIRDFNNCVRCHRSGDEDEVKNKQNERHNDD